MMAYSSPYSTPVPLHSGRMNWIDALRGLTMMSVVMVHVLVSGFGLNPDQSALAILRGTFTLPLFFFVSGFFLFRDQSKWDRHSILQALKVRGMALLVGTCVFATLYFIVMRRKNPLSWLPDGNFVEYWYTLSLFQIFIYYLIFVGISKICRREVIFWNLVLLGMAASILLPFSAWSEKFWCYWWLNEKTLLYFQFFGAGMIVRRFQQPVFAWLERDRLLTLLIIGYVASLCGGWVYREWWTDRMPWVLTLFREELSRWFGLGLVLWIFYNFREWFETPGRIRNIWLKIGRRTLDIYFLHYFLIPRMRWVGPYLVRGNTFIPELIAAAIVSIVIILLILPLSNLLRRAPLIRNLLGAK